MHLQKIINDNNDKSWIVRKFKLTANQMFEQAVINDIIAKNPVKGIKLPTAKKESTKRALSDKETSMIFNIDLDIKTKCFVYLLMFTGIRKSEALALTKSDIDFEKKEIQINKTLVFLSNKSVVKNTTKTRAGERTVKIIEPLNSLLFKYVNGIVTEMLFVTNKGDSFSDTAYRRMWAKFENAMGTRDITAHIFRHNFATMLYNANVDVKTAQVLLGHKSISVTMDIYTHLDNKKLDTAVDLLESHLKSSQTVVN